MKILSVLIMTLTLTGCFYQSVDYKDIKLATLYCEDKGGVREIREHATGITKIACHSDPVGTAMTSEEDAAKHLVLRQSKETIGTTSCFRPPIRQPGERQRDFISRIVQYNQECGK